MDADSVNKHRIAAVRRRVRTEESGDSSSDESEASEYGINTVRVSEKKSRSKIVAVEKQRNDKWQEVINIAGSKLKVVIDTGAECSVIPKALVEKLQGSNRIEVHPTKTRLRSYFGDRCASKEYAHLSLTCGVKTITEKMFIVSSQVAPTINGDTAV